MSIEIHSLMHQPFNSVVVSSVVVTFFLHVKSVLTFERTPEWLKATVSLESTLTLVLKRIKTNSRLKLIQLLTLLAHNIFLLNASEVF